MSDLREIEKRIYDEERIEELLEHLGCWNINYEQGGSLIVAGLPNGDNPRSVQVRNNESLSSAIRSKGVKGSIFDLVSSIKYDAITNAEMIENLSKSKYWICNIFNYMEFIDEFYRDTAKIELQKKDYNKWLKKVSPRKKKKSELTNDIISDYDENDIIPYVGWVEEGLQINTQKHFGVSIDVQTERITFPVHNKDGEVIGLKGRYIGNDEEISNHKKYIYVKPCNKSIELFNLHRAIPHIIARKEVIIVEGGKTTMYLTQWNFPNAVSVEGDSLSEQQVKLLKDLGIDINFIFAYDKDKGLDYVMSEASKVKGRMRNFIFDSNNLLTEKDSPTDKGENVWNELYNNNIYKV